MKTKIVYTLLLGLTVFATCGDACWPVPTGSGGFPVTTVTYLEDSAGNLLASSPAPGEAVSGTWLSDNSGAVGSVKSFGGAGVFTDSDGSYYVNGGRVPASWSLQVIWNPACGEVTSGSVIEPDLESDGYGWDCVLTVEEEGGNVSTHFVLPGGAPSTITSYADFSATYGDPQLRVYVGGSSPAFVSSVTASSVVTGSSATFPFPKQPNGSALAEGFYGLVNTNVTSGGRLVFADASYLAVGGSTTLSSAFGVDAANIVYKETICYLKTGCNPTITTTGSRPILTQYYADNVVSYTGATIPVGSEPVAVKTYGSYTSTTHSGLDIFSTTGPANAIVANSGSSSVSIVSFSTNTNLKNIAVGAQPMALTLNSADTYAYVASYGNGTLAEIDLSTEAVTRTATGLTGALSVAMDPGGSYMWVGGTNNLYKVSLSTFEVVSSLSVAGSVTSLAASNAQNELVYTLVQNCCSGSSTYAATELLLSNLSTPGSYARAAATPYAPYTMNGTLPSAAVLPQATNVVSARFSNGMGASSTPTGFVVYDLVSHQQIMTGTTPTPVRGIASDPDRMFAYFTLPDSNEYIAVPLEYAP